MRSFLYKYGTIMGLTGIISTIIPLYFTIFDYIQFFSLLFFAALGVKTGSLFFSYLPLRLNIFLNVCFTLYGSLLTFYGSYKAAVVGFALIGFASGSLLLVIPAGIYVIRYKDRLILTSSLVWSSVFFTTGILTFVFGKITVTSVFATTVIQLLSAFLLKKFPASYKNPLTKQDLSVIAKSKTKAKNTAFFALFYGFAEAMIIIAFSSKASFPSVSQYIITGAIIVSGAISVFAERKGIFSGFIMLIFITELCFMSLCFWNYHSLIPKCCGLLLGCLISAPLSLFPVLCYYLHGPATLTAHLSDTYVLMILGFIAGLLLPASADEVYFFIIIGILCSFFALFSAWKHRLTLLKSS